MAELQRLLHCKRDAAFMLSISLRTLDNLLTRKELKPVRIGGRVMISADELQRFIKKDHPTQAAA